MNERVSPVLVLLAILFSSLGSAQDHIYVDDDGPSVGADGKSWATAFTEIQDAVDDADPATHSQTIIHVADGTYTTPVDLGTKTGLQIIRDTNDLVILEGNLGPGPGMLIAGGQSQRTLISGITFQNWTTPGLPLGESGGSALTIGTLGATGPTSPQIVDCTFQDNQHDATTENGGAAIRIHVYCSPYIYDCTFEDNETTGSNGAAIFARALTPAASTFPDPTIESSVFRNNQAREPGAPSGGAIAFQNCKGTIEDCEFYDNVSVHGGGAVYTNSSDGVVVEGCHFERNISERHISGGVYMNLAGGDENRNYVVGCTFLDNVAWRAAGVCAIDADVTVAHCSFERNVARPFPMQPGPPTAGGVGFRSAVDDMSVNIVNCRFFDNSVSDQESPPYTSISTDDQWNASQRPPTARSRST